IVPDEIASVKGKVLTREEKRFHQRNRKSYLKVAISDGSGILFLVFFNQPYLKNVFTLDKEFFINGRVEMFNGQMQMVNPLYEEYRQIKKDWILPVYPLTSGLTQKYMRRLMKFIIEKVEEYPAEILPLEERQKLNLPNIKFALQNIHFPRSDINLEKARNYLIFREFFILQLGLLLKKEKNQRISSNVSVDTGENVIDIFQSRIPFKLTKTQIQVMEDILRDIKEGKIISRMVHGEVGSGKTVIAVFALWLFSRKGYQSALLSPTEILAEQHYINWQKFFLEQDIPVALLLGQLPESEKRKIKEEIKNGKINVLIGTHTLLTETLEFRNLKMAVVDELHKFGVKQRERLKEKGEGVHYIVMSATPIPRSVALTFYGALDVSVIGEIPKGERQVGSYIFPLEEKEKVYEFIRYQGLQGKQGYVVTPAIEGNEDIESAIEEYERIREKMPEIPVAILHGRMSYTEKDEIMRRFRNKKVMVLVATTVIESGIDVPESTYIIIEQAERFGLAQLHQLRGRVGRTGDTGYCILVPYSSDDKSIMERLESFVETKSGFEIAEIDLKIRGQGDLLGVRQHGIPPLRIGNIVKDMELLGLAREKAESVIRLLPQDVIKERFLREVFINE
ncbi:MAG: ATP-dependent DNA helicase RecG, partial [Candidatus Omnitrophica bacterium]|nr:ATP-dependent DNA helicase RecG [Candidatus Omnitrophota bacterium]